MPRISRPKVIKGYAYQVTTGCENMYITISGLESNGASPIELIARIGKSGGCTNCFTEAIGRLISIGLQWGVPIREYKDTLKGLQCDNPHPFPSEERCLSCPDGIAIAIGEHLDVYKKDS